MLFFVTCIVPCIYTWQIEPGWFPHALLYGTSMGHLYVKAIITYKVSHAFFCYMHCPMHIYMADRAGLVSPCFVVWNKHGTFVCKSNYYIQSVPCFFLLHALSHAYIHGR